jgi:hypothetical protein
MTGKEKVLYHQIHPLKLATDGSMALISLPLLWQHRLRAALLAQSMPPVLVSAALIAWADLDPQRQSALGRYIAQYMSPGMQALRFAGNAVMAVGAWQRRPYLVLAGLLVVLFGWLRGVFFPRRAAPSADGSSNEQ